MPRVPASSPRAVASLALVEALQRRFVEKLEAWSGQTFTPVVWLRDEGRHGGGVRFAHADSTAFNRASVNVSSVHYDDQPKKKLAGATALSTIIHPANPYAPSLHLHLSHTELRDGQGTWRLMADLNPSHHEATEQACFEEGLRQAAPHLFDAARAQGARYFFIPALGRHRGVTHFYVDDFSSGDFGQDLALAKRVGESTIDTYVELVREALARNPSPSDDERAKQLAYHTLYFFQVLTLDRGTTSGLLVHDQNDLGIMGSLPSRVDRALLRSWEPLVPTPQAALLRALVDALPDEHPAPVTDAVRLQLAQLVRQHYRAHPEALALQAAGDVVPPTVEKHR